MTRKEFIELAGGSTLMFCLGCARKETIAPTGTLNPHELSGYGEHLPPERDTSHHGPMANYPGYSPPPPKLDFTIDISQSPYTALQTAGGVAYEQSAIIAHTVNGPFIAAQSWCTHAGVIIDFHAGNDRYECPGHGSKFEKNGAVIAGPAASPLKIYQTALSGTLLRVYEI